MISAIRRNEILMYTTIFINLSSIVKRERSHNKKPKHHYAFTHIAEKGKLIEKKIRLVVVRDKADVIGLSTKGHEATFWEIEMFSISVMHVGTNYICVKTHRTILLKRMTIIACKF